MSFYDQLREATAADRAGLLAAPAIAAGLAGRVTRNMYLAFLEQAYHHVKHATPLFMALGARLPDRLAWLRWPVAEYIEEKIGREEWILNDIAAVGGDSAAVYDGVPGLATEVMVAYAYDLVNRRDAVGLLGMEYVLEGTGVALALHAADHIQRALALPDTAFSYLRSHDAPDPSHNRQLADLMNRLDADDQRAMLRAARVFFKLYGDVFRALPVEREAALWN